MKRTTRPVNDLIEVMARRQFPVKVIDRDGDEHTVEYITWICNTCYCHCTEHEWDLAASLVRKIEQR